MSSQELSEAPKISQRDRNKKSQELSGDPRELPGASRSFPTSKTPKTHIPVHKNEKNAENLRRCAQKLEKCLKAICFTSKHEKMQSAC